MPLTVIFVYLYPNDVLLGGNTIILGGHVSHISQARPSRAIGPRSVVFRSLRRCHRGTGLAGLGLPRYFCSRNVADIFLAVRLPPLGIGKLRP